MTQRRRFFPATGPQKIPGRTVDLGLALQRVQAVAVTPVASAPVAGDPQPPVWARWFDDADAPATDIRIETFREAAGFLQGWFSEGPAVAHVEGGIAVEWDVTFVPTLWDPSGSVIWEGDVLSSTLPLAASPGDPPLPPLRAIVPPTFGAAEPTMYWPHQWRDYAFDVLYEPSMVAAGNTLSVAIVLGGCPGVLEATARVGALVLGTVRLTAYLEVSVPD